MTDLADPAHSIDLSERARFAAAVVRLVGVTKVYGAGATAVTALASATLDVRAGELVLIQGPSGSGKTTLVSILGLLLAPTSGQVWIEGRDVAHLGERELPPLRARNFGFVFQRFNLFPALTALENVATAIAMKNPHAIRAQVRDEARAWLDVVGLADRAHRMPGELSGGQQQRVAIARALGGNPPIVIGDEPTAALDTQSAMGVMDVLRALASERRRAVVIVTHDPRLERFADRVLRVEDGALHAAEVVPR